MFSEKPKIPHTRETWTDAKEEVRRAANEEVDIQNYVRLNPARIDILGDALVAIINYARGGSRYKRAEKELIRLKEAGRDEAGTLNARYEELKTIFATSLENYRKDDQNTWLPLKYAEDNLAKFEETELGIENPYKKLDGQILRKTD